MGLVVGSSSPEFLDIPGEGVPTSHPEEISSGRLPSVEFNSARVARRALELVAGRTVVTDTLVAERADGVHADLRDENERILLRQGRELVTFLTQLTRRLEDADVTFPDGVPVAPTVEAVARYAAKSDWIGIDFFRTDLDEVGSSTWRKSTQTTLPPLFHRLRELQDSPSTPGAFVAQHQLSELTPVMRSEIARLCRNRAIDPLRSDPQNGFHWAISEAEIGRYLQEDCAVLFTLHAQGRLAGMFLLYTDFSPLSRGGRRVCEDWCIERRIDPGRVAYGELVGISEEVSATFRDYGESAYRMLLNSVDETCRLLGFSHILGEVRVGNLAMDKHTAVGWERTGRTRPHDPFPGVTLELVARDLLALERVSGPRTYAHSAGLPHEIAVERRGSGVGFSISSDGATSTLFIDAVGDPGEEDPSSDRVRAWAFHNRPFDTIVPGLCRFGGAASTLEELAAIHGSDGAREVFRVAKSWAQCRGVTHFFTEVVDPSMSDDEFRELGWHDVSDEVTDSQEEEERHLLVARISSSAKGVHDVLCEKIAPPDSLALVVGDPAAIARERRLSPEAIRDPASAGEYVLTFLSSRGLSQYIDSLVLLDDSQGGVGIPLNGVVLVSGSTRRWTFIQEATGVDQWCLEPGGKVGTFRECLDLFTAGIQREPREGDRVARF